MPFPTHQRLCSALSAGLLIASLGVNVTVGAVGVLQVAELVTSCGRSAAIAANHLEADGAGKIRFAADAFRMTNALLAFINHFDDGGVTPHGYDGVWGAIDAAACMKYLQVTSSDVAVSVEPSIEQAAVEPAQKARSNNLFAMWSQLVSAYGAAANNGASAGQATPVAGVVSSASATDQAASSDTATAVGSAPLIAQSGSSSATASCDASTAQPAPSPVAVSSAPATDQVSASDATTAVNSALSTEQPASSAGCEQPTMQAADATFEQIAQVLLRDILPAAETTASVVLAADGMVNKPEHKKLRICLRSLISWLRTLQVCCAYRNTPEAQRYVGVAVAHTLLTLWELFRDVNVPLSTLTPVVTNPTNPTPVQPVQDFDLTLKT